MGTQSTWGVFRGAFSSSTFEPPVTMSEKPAPASMAGGSLHGAPRPREHNDGEETTTPQTAMQTGLMSTDTAIVAAENAKELEFDAKKKHPVPSNPHDKPHASKDKPHTQKPIITRQPAQRGHN